jgi:hypothetical protein
LPSSPARARESRPSASAALPLAVIVHAASRFVAKCVGFVSI